MSDSILTSLSIITSFHDKSKSIIDAFLPVVEYGIAILSNEKDSKYFDVESLQEKILNSTGIHINSVTLKSLLKRLKNEKHIELLEQGKYYGIIGSFKDRQDKYLSAIKTNYRNIHKFINEYKKCENKKMQENDDNIILDLTSENTNPYIKYRMLVIDKKTGKPIKMECKSENKKEAVYILYTEVKLNTK